MLASDVLDKAAIILLDSPNDRWTSAELIDYLNLAQKELAKHKPAASKTRVSVIFVTGTQQSLPVGGVMLLDLDRNIKSDDSIGNAIRYADKASLDSFDPDWHLAAEETQTESYCYDAKMDPKIYWISPPVKVGGKGELVYAKIPTTVIATTDTLDLDDDYEAPLVDYVVARALSKDNEVQDLQKASAFYQAFYQSIGVRTAAQDRYRAKAQSES